MHTRPEAPPVAVVNKKGGGGERPLAPAWPIEVVVKSEAPQNVFEFAMETGYQARLMKYLGGKFVIPAFYYETAQNTDAHTVVYFSENGLDWDKAEIPGRTGIPLSLAYNNGTYAIGTGLGDIYASTNLVSWSRKYSFGATEAVHAMTYAGAWMVGCLSQFARSANLTAWTTAPFSGVANIMHDLGAGMKFLAVGDGLYTSDDGLNFSVEASVPQTARFLTIVTNGSKILLVGGDLNPAWYSGNGGNSWGLYPRDKRQVGYTFNPDTGKFYSFDQTYGEVSVSSDLLTWSPIDGVFFRPAANSEKMGKMQACGGNAYVCLDVFHRINTLILR